MKPPDLERLAKQPVQVIINAMAIAGFTVGLWCLAGHP